MDDSVKRNTSGFREPILKKYEAVKNAEIQDCNCKEISVRNGEGGEQSPSHIYISFDSNIHASCTAQSKQGKLESTSSNFVESPGRSPVVVASSSLRNTETQESGGFIKNTVENSCLEGGDSFCSKQEELDILDDIHACFNTCKDAVRIPFFRSDASKGTIIEEVLPGTANLLSSPLKETEEKNSTFFKNEDQNQPGVENSTVTLTVVNPTQMDCDSLDTPVEEDFDSCDDELLTPPRFLYEENRLKPDIKTPQKGLAPEYSSPVVPHEDVKGKNKEKNFNFKPYRLSFEKLISEKAKRKEKDAELAKMEAELQHSIQNGGVAQVEPYGLSDLESEEELTDDGRDLKECTLPHEIKKLLVEVNDFSEDLPVEDIFPLFMPCLLSQDVPCVTKVIPSETDTFEAKLWSASALDLRELLCGGWIQLHYLNKACRVEVAEWLFEIMCRHQDQHIVSCSFQTLQVMLDANTEKRDDLAQVSRGIAWLPSIRKVIMELLSYGAILPRLYPSDLASDLNIHELLGSETSSRARKIEEGTIVNSGLMTENFPVVNIMHMLQYITYGLQKCQGTYTTLHLRQLVVLLCRLALDVRLQTVVFDIEMCIAAALNCLGEAQWPDEVKELCHNMAKVASNHHQLLHVCQIQPQSARGVHLQRLLSLTLLHWLVPRLARGDIQNGKRAVKTICDADVPDSIEISSLVRLVEKIKMGEHSDYYLLHTVLSLLGLAVGSEDVSPKERAALEQLTNKLRTLNGEIKDPRAAFMDRTKVKDLLVRTIHRLVYMVQCIRPPREQITSYFEFSKSDYHIELLKETVQEDITDPLEKEGCKDGTTLVE